MLCMFTCCIELFDRARVIEATYANHERFPHLKVGSVFRHQGEMLFHFHLSWKYPNGWPDDGATVTVFARAWTCLGSMRIRLGWRVFHHVTCHRGMVEYAVVRITCTHFNYWSLWLAYRHRIFVLGSKSVHPYLYSLDPRGLFNKHTRAGFAFGTKIWYLCCGDTVIADGCHHVI